MTLRISGAFPTTVLLRFSGELLRGATDFQGIVTIVLRRSGFDRLQRFPTKIQKSVYLHDHNLPQALMDTLFLHISAVSHEATFTSNTGDPNYEKMESNQPEPTKRTQVQGGISYLLALGPARGQDFRARRQQFPPRVREFPPGREFLAPGREFLPLDQAPSPEAGNPGLL